MSRRAHQQTYVVVILVQILAMLLPVVWWIGHKHPPAWNVWVNCFVMWPIFLLCLLLFGGLCFMLSDKIADVKRKRAHKND